MTDALTFVVAGLTVGSTMGLVAVGLVLTYRTSGILNFAQGALAIVAVDAYIYFTVNRGYSWQVATALSVVGVGALMGLALAPFGRVLARAPSWLQVVATIGVLLAIESGSNLLAPHLAGPNPHFVEPPMPIETVEIAGVFVGKDQLIVMAVSLVCVLALFAFLRYARIGLAMRAVVANPELLELSGTRAEMVRRWAWVIGSVFAALSGVLLALSPTFGASPGTVEVLVVPSFAAAAVAMFLSLPLAYVGGLAVGVVSALLVRYITPSWLLGLPSAAPYLILLVALFVIPKRRLARAAAAVPTTRLHDLRAPLGVDLVAGVALAVVVALIPGWVGFSINRYTTTLVYVVLFLSLGLLLKTGSLVSLCQMGFAAIGATTFARLSTELDVPWLVALAGGVLAAAVVGTIVALSAVRLSGVFLALATLAFGLLLQTLLYSTDLMFSTESGSLTAPRPSFASSDTQYYVLVAALTAACIAIVVAIDRTRLGRLLRGAADSSVAMQTQGTTTMVSNLTIFAVSAGMAGLAGALLSSSTQFVTEGTYAATASLTLVALVFVVRLDHPWYAIVAAIAFYLLPLELDVVQAGTWIQLIAGVLAVTTVVLGLASRRRARRRARARPATTQPTPRHARAPALPVVARRPAAALPGRGLETRGLTVRFGGLVALDRVDLHAAPGAITGLIGPNGAGKTTLLNVCSGLVRPTAGRVLLHGADMSRRSVASRARHGIGRTFQRPELFDSLTVRAATALAVEASSAGTQPLHHLVGGRGASHLDDPAVDEAMALSGVDRLADQVVGELSAAQRRLVELARCLSGAFDMLLLDEPTAGLERAESRDFVATLRDVVDARGVGVLLVEHDMGVVTEACDRVTVLDFGVVLFEGAPADVFASAEVRAAYLGDAVATDLSPPRP